MEVAWRDQPVARGPSQLCVHTCWPSLAFSSHPIISPALLKSPTYSLLIMRKPDDPAKGFPLPPLWGGR